MSQDHDPRKSKWAWDTEENRRIYVGNRIEWDPVETEKRRWTEPIVTGATKAPHGHPVFLSGRLRCCKDLNECGVQVKVIQASIQDWHYKRVWNRGKNSKYQFKCKNEANVSGVSRFHHTVVNEIHRCLAGGRPVLGKTIAELPPPELPVRELAGKEPDIYVKFDDGSYLAIEVVYTHAPDREVHEQYQENMVDIRLKELDEIHDDAAFNRWVQADGVWDLFLAEVEPAQRRARWEARQKVFDVKDEQKHLREVEQRISKCREKFNFPYGGDKTTVIDLDDIDAWFKEEKENRERQKEIWAAINANEKKYQTKFEGDPSIFGRKKDVDDYFAEQNKPLIEEWEAERKALEEELGVEIPAKYVTSQQMNYFADEKRREAERERLNEILPPLIKELEEEVGIEVDSRFNTLGEFEEFAKSERRYHRKRTLKSKLVEEYKADVEKLGKEYEEWLTTGLEFNDWSSARFDKFMEIAERLRSREYRKGNWDKGYGWSHMVKGVENGTGYFWSLSCGELDRLCQQEGKHTCLSMQSEVAGSLLGCMRLDKEDLRFGRLKLVADSGARLSWRDRGSIRENRTSLQQEPKEASEEWTDAIPEASEQETTTMVRDEEDIHSVIISATRMHRWENRHFEAKPRDTRQDKVDKHETD